jgi:nickel/cobalt transporter (NicO) family protein
MFRVRIILPAVAWVLAIAAMNAPQPVRAHPHCFILNSVQFFFDDQGLDRIRIDWQFDTFFSEQIMSDCVSEAGSALGPEEKACIKRDYFDNLSEYGYFTFININGRPVEVSSVESLDVAYLETSLVYRFTLPCRVPATGHTQEVRVALYDPTFYCALLFPEQLPVMVNNEGNLDYSVHIRENTNVTYYYNQIHPWEAVLRFCRPPCEEIPDGASPALTDDGTASPAETSTAGDKSMSLLGGSGHSFRPLIWILEKQRLLYERMADVSRRIKDGNRGRPLALLLGIAFLYGLVHAAGPGHGKAFAASFVLAAKPGLKQSLLLGNTIALFHGLSAATLVILLKTTLVAFTGQSLEQVQNLTGIVSYSLISLIGLLLVSGVVKKMRNHGPEESRPDHPANVWVMAATVGLVPCPGVVLVLLFSLSLDILWVGLLMALFQTAGMALTISLVTLLVAGGRRGGTSLFKRNEQMLHRVETGMELLASLCVFLLGLIFLWGTISR